MNKLITSNFQQETTSVTEDSDEDDEEDDTQGWNGLQLDPPDQEVVASQCGQGKYDHLKDAFILDTGSTISATVMNPKMLTGIRKSKKPTYIIG